LTTDRARPDTDDPLPGKPEDVVRVRLRYPDLDTFVEKYAPNVTRGGIFLASRDPRPVGEVLRFEVLLRQGGPVLSGEGRVTWVKEFNPAEPHRPYGMGVQFLYVDPDARPVLDRLLTKKELSRSGPQATLSSPAPSAEPRAAAPVPDLRATSDEDLDETTMRRALDRARVLSSRTDDLDALLAPDPEESPATLSQALAELPRLLSGKKT
jgi:uncharacterized protein (TIGR02266 family)